MDFRRYTLISILFCACIIHTWSGAAAESADSSSRGKYVAAQGRIIPADEIDISSYIASINYGYPDPSDDLGLNLFAGHTHVSLNGQEELIQIGIQGKRTPFDKLPTMNLAFVVDKSGSMSEADKIQWAKEAFEIFIRRLRRKDIVSVVAFAEDVEVVLPATPVSKIHNVSFLCDRVQEILPEGKSKLSVGLLEGYQQVQKNFRPQHVNRVIFISDGLGSFDAAFDMAREYKEKGITLSTITVGMNCDLNSMIDLSKEGAGSSRFLSDEEKMEEIFNTDLDRTFMPIAYNLRMELELLHGAELQGTWGYRHEAAGSKISYFLPALHHRDYETILAQVTLPPQTAPGAKEVARFTVEYEDRQGVMHQEGPHFLTVEYADSAISEGGISDPTVLKSGTMLHLAMALEDIAVLYYSCPNDSAKQYSLNALTWQNREAVQETPLDKAVAMEKTELSGSVRAKKQRCLDLAVALKKEIQNTHLRLGEECFPDELTIVKQYIEILGNELRLGANVVSALLEEKEIRIEEVAVDHQEQLQDLVDELTFPLRDKGRSQVAFLGMTAEEDETSQIKSAADSLIRSKLGQIQGARLVRTSVLEKALEQLEFGPQDLMDNEAALKAGSKANADYIITGMILPMPFSYIVFGKVLEIKSGDVESVAQVILPKNR